MKTKTEPTPTAIPPPDPKARADALKSLTDLRRASAWPLHRFPMSKRLVGEGRVRVYLPKTYLARGGEEVRAVREGEDLNQVVYAYYSEIVSAEKGEGEEWVNYVHADKVVSRRHEYLGPDPRVAGYWTDVSGDVHIRWYDAWLKDQWMDKSKWKMNVVVDEKGKWVEKDSE